MSPLAVRKTALRSGSVTMDLEFPRKTFPQVKLMFYKGSTKAPAAESACGL
jgi:hypothetical protein